MQDTRYWILQKVPHVMTSNNLGHPPKCAERLLGLTVSRDIRNRVMGDLEEMYFHRLEAKGRVRAGVWYWMQVLRSGFPMLRDALYWNKTGGPLWPPGLIFYYNTN